MEKSNIGQKSEGMGIVKKGNFVRLRGCKKENHELAGLGWESAINDIIDFRIYVKVIDSICGTNGAIKTPCGHIIYVSINDVLDVKTGEEMEKIKENTSIAVGEFVSLNMFKEGFPIARYPNATSWTQCIWWFEYEAGEFVEVVKEIAADSWGVVKLKSGEEVQVSLDHVLAVKPRQRVIKKGDFVRLRLSEPSLHFFPPIGISSMPSDGRANEVIEKGIYVEVTKEITETSRGAVRLRPDYILMININDVLDVKSLDELKRDGCNYYQLKIEKGQFVSFKILQNEDTDTFLYQNGYVKGDFVEVVQEITETSGAVLLKSGYRMSVTLSDIRSATYREKGGYLREYLIFSDDSEKDTPKPSIRERIAETPSIQKEEKEERRSYEKDILDAYDYFLRYKERPLPPIAAILSEYHFIQAAKGMDYVRYAERRA